MICRCGVHFCYVCGRRWEEHANQPGGLNYYKCRLTADNTPPPAPPTGGGTGTVGGGSAVDNFDACARDAGAVRLWAREAAELWEALGSKEVGLARFLAEAAEELLAARQDMRFAAVFAWAAAREGNETGPLEFWLGELEGACATLEAVLGPSFALAAEAGGTPQRSARSSWPTLATTGGDLR
eukprot:CAMPEP_0171121626 /NCGR_PEP_ID=MMETSP0766_2-20121228/102983_1 /TAXON_ID=439317 /ORGANISM="Gambierdiscus australes, Strain CAWD 149" /LENGTH=182 /DNA_ID=CAMNT_0011584415 /DNA_START=75 /DNA_END=620 /DNA_ORIENTATION=-